MKDKPISILTSLEGMAGLVKQNSDMTVEKISNIEQATTFIKDNDSKIANAWFNLSHALKKVRDEKLYEGKYSDFEDYFENELKYGKTAVYRFIKIADTFPLNTKEEVIRLGVTKLINIAALDEEKREEFLEENNVENMTVEEIKANVKQIKEVFVPKNDNVNISFTPDEYDKVKEVYVNFNKLNTIIEELATTTSQETPIDYNKMYVLYDKCSKAKSQIRQMEKMLRKYI